jgi:hypothetical protein
MPPVFDGSIVLDLSPHLAMWATNITPSSTVFIQNVGVAGQKKGKE